jgi:hypothetical protein
MATVTVVTPYQPTAAQKFAAGQDTPSSSGEPTGTVPGGFAALCTCQDLPFHRSAKLTGSPEVPTVVPTAVHASAAEQETDLSWPPPIGAFGEFLIVHARLAMALAPPVAASAATAGDTTVAAARAQAARAVPQILADFP